MTTIVIADRNPNVRKLIEREFVADGYQVKTSGIGQELLVLISQTPDTDTLIIDPEIEDDTDSIWIEQLRKINAGMRIIIHSTEQPFPGGSRPGHTVERVAKNWNSIHELKKMIKNKPVTLEKKTNLTGDLYEKE